MRLTTAYGPPGPYLKIGMVVERPGVPEAQPVTVLAMVDSGAWRSIFPLSIAHDLGLEPHELREDPDGGAGVASTFRVWMPTLPIRAGIAFFELDANGYHVPWGPGFPLEPAFTEAESFLLGRADFFRSFAVTFELDGNGQPCFHLDTPDLPAAPAPGGADVGPQSA